MEGSQEPRRPRFSFFHLHNFKELTSGPAAGRRRWKQCFRILANRTFSPVARQQVCPFRIVEQWEQQVLGVVNVAGCIRDVSVCQHPFFNFRFAFDTVVCDPELETLKLKNALFFRGLLQSLASCGAAVLSGERGYMEGRLSCKPPKATKSSFSAPPPLRQGRRRTGAYIVRARRGCKAL